MAGKRSLLLLAILLLNSLALGLAQGAASRQAGELRSSLRVTLGSSKPPAVAALGAPVADLRLERMLLLLEPSAEQQQALLAKLASLQNPASAEYHRWLTPAAFADAYSNSPSDVAAVSAWLASQGLAVAPVPASRAWIEFSGTAGQVEQAFQASLTLAATPTGTRAVLTSAISVPAALAPLIHGLVSLDGVVAAPAIVTPRPLALSAAELAQQSSLAQAAAVTPRLLTAQLHLDSVQASGTTGAGQTIGLAARANPAAGDVAAFRAAFGLPAGPLSQRGEAVASPTADDLAAATLMASWAGVAAPGAQLALEANSTTAATDGVDLSLAALVDGASFQSLVVGYSACEAALSEAHQAFYAALYRQAAAEGITVAAATGDSGSAACFKAGSDAPVTSGFAVNALASTPWNTAVGAAGFASGGLSLTAWSPVNPADPAYASGGGVSSLYAIPAWQASAAASGAAFRVLPDLVLPTALDSASSTGLAFCLNSAASGLCTLQRSGGSAAAAALLAGISALAAETSGAQGNLADRLYTASLSQGIYQDIQQGTAQLKCETATAGCDATGEIGYAAAQGFDLATGLGSVDAQALVTQLARPVANAWGNVNIQLQASAQTVGPTTPITLTAQLSTSGNFYAADMVSFKDVTTNTTLETNRTLNTTGTNTTITTTYSSGLGSPGIIHVLEATFTDSVTNVQTTASTNVTVALGTTSLAVSLSNYAPLGGDTFTATATVSEGQYAATAPPGGWVTLKMGSIPYSAQLIGNGNSSTATFSLTAPDPAQGQQSITVNYGGDSNYAASSPQTTSVNAQQNPGPKLTLPSGLSGEPAKTVQVDVRIQTSAAAATTAKIYPTGSLTATIDGTAGTPVTFSASAADSTIAIPVLMPNSSGSHSLTVAYSGDDYYKTSSANTTLTATKVTPNVTATWPANPVAGNPITVTVKVASPTSTSSTPPTGTVNYTVDGGTAVGASLTTSSANAATAPLSLSALAVGKHTLSVTYEGDSNYLSASSTFSIDVAKAPTVTTLTVLPLLLSSSTTETLTAVVAPATTVSGATYTLSGTVTFYDGAKALGAPVTVTGNKAVLTGIKLVTSVTHTITAVYSGDTTWETSTSSAVILAATTTPVTVLLTSNLTNVPAGRALVLTATITPDLSTTSVANPTGSVVFYEGTTILGSAALTPISLTNTSFATLTLQTVTGGNWTGGTHTIFAVYLGDTVYDTATSNLLTVTVQDFTLTLNPTSPSTNIDIVKGGNGSVSFNVKSLGGFSGQVQVTCTAPSTAFMTCTASPQLIYPTADVTFVVQTSSSGTVTAHNSLPLWSRAAGGTALAVLAFFLLPFGRRARRFLTLLLLLAGLATAGVGCNKVATVNAQGTPLGVATLKVVATVYVDNTVVNRTGYFSVNVVNP